MKLTFLVVGGGENTIYIINEYIIYCVKIQSVLSIKATVEWGSTRMGYRK